MIQFNENQTKIFIGKNKITKSLFSNHLDFHLVYSQDLSSGYESKFVRIVAIENIYSIDDLKNIKTETFNDVLDIIYFENGGYLFDKKTF